VGQSHGGDAAYKVSTYDARRAEPKGAPRTFPPGHKVVETYLGGWDLKNDPDNGQLSSDVSVHVLEAIHASAATEAGQRYKECTDPPYNALKHQDGLGVADDVVAILQHPSNVRLLFFNGMEDLICSHPGNEKLLENLSWTGRENWINGRRYAWVSQFEQEGKVSGYMKEYENLMFLKLLDSGHMVPLDIPEKALDMMRIFMSSSSFETSLQTLATAEPDDSCPVCPTCDECPVCPRIPEPVEPPSSSSAANQSSVPASATKGNGLLQGLIAIAVILGVVVIFLIIRNRMLMQRDRQMQRVSQYDVELRESSYSDGPENGFS